MTKQDDAEMQDYAKKILFVSGVGRSGTSALVEVLNSHPRIVMGQERFFYKIRRSEMAPDLFDKERFLDVRSEDTHGHAGLIGNPDQLPEKFDRSIYIGDKFPSLFRHFEEFFQIFPDARHLYIVRNPLSVIESYDQRNKNPKDNWTLTWKDGLEAWNESVSKVANLPPEHLAKFTIVQYEELYSSVEAINALFSRLGLEAASKGRLKPFIEKFETLNQKPVARRDDLRIFVARNADWQSYKALCDIMERQGV